MSVVSLRAAQEGDAQAISEIYNYEVENSTATFDLVPRSLEVQREWIAARSGAFSAIVAVDSVAGVIGFGALSTYRAVRATEPRSRTRCTCTVTTSNEVLGNCYLPLFSNRLVIRASIP